MGATKERKRWLKENRDQILAYAREHSIRDTLRHFGIGLNTYYGMKEQAESRVSEESGAQTEALASSGLQPGMRAKPQLNLQP